MLGKTFCELHFQKSVRKKRQPVPGHLKLERIQILSKLKLESGGGFSDSVSFMAIKLGATSRNNEPDLSVVVKETGVHDLEEDVIFCDPEPEIIVFIPGKMSDFVKSQQFHIIRVILLVINDSSYDGLAVLLVVYYDKKECRVCKACIPDLHRSFDFCYLIPRLASCDDIRGRHLHSKLQDLKMISKSSKTKTWRFDLDVPLTSFNPFTLTKDLEESAKRTLSTKQEFKNNNLEHFLKHWGVGKLIIIQAMIQTQPDLDWDFGFLLCEYLKISVEYQNNTKTGFCEIEFRRKQIFLGGIKHEYVWSESLKFKLQFSSDFLQNHFPNHYNAILQSLPIQDYIYPLMGSMNLGAYSPLQIKNPYLSSYDSLGYGGLDNPAHPDLLSNLCFHPYDENLPSIRESIKAAAKKTKNINEKKIKKKKIVCKCHWCGLTSFCILIMCLTFRENFFCEDCIDNRCYCKRSVERKCHVCEGQCSCKASTCRRGKPKQVKTKKNVTTASIPEKMSDFDKSQHLHMIRELLRVISKMNQQKFIELDTEAKNKGTSHSKIEVQTVAYTDKKECRVCKACVPDVHRSCEFCSFVLCLACCHDIHEGNLHSKLPDLKLVRSKRLKNKSWSFGSDGSISCPPKSLGGCNKGALHLTSFYPFTHTKDLEESAKQILCDFKINGSSDSSPCPLCGETGLYFSTKQEFKNNNLEHFMKHWGEGIRDMFQTQPNLKWDFGVMLREYLKKCAESRNNAVTGSAESTREWCEIEFGRTQIFSGGRTQECKESLKFKLQFSSEFLQDRFPDHHGVILRSLPIQEYMNPFTGFMNLGVYSPLRVKNPNLGSDISISYGGMDSPAHPDILSNLCFRPYDEVNILVHATDRPIREKSLNELKTLIDKDNSHDRLEGMIAGTSRADDAPLRLEGTSNHEVVLVSDDEDISLDTDSCGAHWDIFRKEDVPMLLKFLKKYSEELTESHSSRTKVVHPLFDELIYLNDFHKMRLKEEFNVDALCFNQYTGEAVVIPAGCVYQTKRVKSCVHVVYEFMSPESARNSIKVSDEVRLIPLKYKARGNTVPVENTAILRMKASIEGRPVIIRNVFQTQPDLNWDFGVILREYLKRVQNPKTTRKWDQQKALVSGVRLNLEES